MRDVRPLGALRPVLLVRERRRGSLRVGDSDDDPRGLCGLRRGTGTIVTRNSFRKPADVTYPEAAFLEPLSCVVHSVAFLAPKAGVDGGGAQAMADSEFCTPLCSGVEGIEPC